MREHFEIIVNSLVYILNKFDNRTIDVHKLFKIFYFAEQKHLSKYGKNITTDTFQALPYGPVPTDAYNIIKASRTEGKVENEWLQEFSKCFATKGYNVTSLIDVDLDWLSKSEIKCLDEAVEENKNLSFIRLTKKSHDSAWDKAFPVMETKDIAEAGGANEAMLNYISSKEELRHIKF
ncbi:MAG: Panacea domain-containing protein [Flavobacteriales bacterium]